MQMCCKRMAETMQLIEDLFLPRGVTATVEHLHTEKRRARAIFSTNVTEVTILPGLFSAYRIVQPCSEQRAVKENKKHIILTIQRLAQRQETIIERI